MIIKGTLAVPGDKSISHRAIMLGSLAKGKTRISHFLRGADCLSTIGIFEKMGVSIHREGERVEVEGLGLQGLCPPEETLDCGNSGTTIRLLSGILAGQHFSTSLSGDASIQKRPMDRVITPLRLMGAEIQGTRGSFAPLSITGAPLKGIHYASPVASAQVKSALLFAGLYAQGDTAVTEPYLSRNHSEIMLKNFGASVIQEGTTTTLSPVSELFARDIFVPGDISSAAFFIAAALLLPGSELILKNVGTNPTRRGMLTVLGQMGANIETLHCTKEGEEYSDLLIRSAPLHGITIQGGIIPSLIDELPILAGIAALAQGTTVIRDAAELKVKESNRIRVMCEELTKLGVKTAETPDGMIIEGKRDLKGNVTIQTHGDHRIAMTFAVLNLVSQGEIRLDNRECVNISYPGFFEDVKSLLR